MRYTTAQFLPFFENNLWLKNAQNANNMAQKLCKGIAEIVGDAVFTQKTQANIVLLKLPETVINKLLENHFFYIWNHQENEIRLVTSWDTTENDISVFLDNLKNAVNK